MKKILYPILLLLLFPPLLSCFAKDEVVLRTDLSYFNLKGNVKSFSELTVAIGLSATDNFDTYARQQVNYHEHLFDKSGRLLTVENRNPSPYALQGFAIAIKREQDSLIITQKSPKEIYVRTYRKAGDTLSFATYNKLDDNVYDYHSEKYKQQVYVQHGGSYIMNAYREGINAQQVYEERQYSVAPNQKGNDSLVYLKVTDRDSVLLYTVKYLQFDKKGNWLAKQFVKSDQKQIFVTSYTIYRKIGYYD